MKIRVHRLLVLSRRSTNQLSRRLPIIDLHKLIDDHVGFELAFNLVEVIERDTGKVVYGRVRVLGIQRCGLASQVEGETSEKTQIVVIYRTMFVLCQPDDGFVVLHVIGKGYADTAYGVILDLVHEERGISDVLANPVGIWTLRHRPLQDVRLLDACEESVEVFRFVINDGSSRYLPQQLLDEW